MSEENWHEERDRLVQLIEAVEKGDVTHIDQGHLRQLQQTNPVNVAMLKDRLAKLNARLGERTTPQSPVSATLGPKQPLGLRREPCYKPLSVAPSFEQSSGWKTDRAPAC